MLLKHKLLATGTHFLINLIACSILLIIILSAWYPEPFFNSSGGFEGLKIVAMVDIVLGPLLTFVIFNPNKLKHLIKFDLSVILFLQIAAFVWGVSTIYQQRPVALTFWEDRFYTVDAKSISDLGFSERDLAQFGDKAPVIVFVERSLDPDQADALSKRIRKEAHPPFDFVDLYLPYRDYFDQISVHSVTMENIEQVSEDTKTQLTELKKSLPNLEYKNMVGIKVESKYSNTYAIFMKSGELIGYVDASK